MTTRERYERKIERRREWANSAQREANRKHETFEHMMSVIPMGQPILIGHHSEKRDRNYRERAWGNLGKAVEASNRAGYHESKADGLEAQLDRAIYSDDDNAIEALESRIAEREAERENMKKVNALYKKSDIAGLAALGVDYEQLKAKLAALGNYFGQAPYMPYSLQNLGARINSDKKRLEQLKREAKDKQAAESSPNGVTLKDCSGGYCVVRFAEKPSREILDALRGAGFRWLKGSWGGLREKLPNVVNSLLSQDRSETCHTEDSATNNETDEVIAS